MALKRAKIFQYNFFFIVECPPCFGMIKVEVDKFRQQILSLKVLLRSLLDMDLLSQSFSFTGQLQIIQDGVEQIVLNSEVIYRFHTKRNRMYCSKLFFPHLLNSFSCLCLSQAMLARTNLRLLRVNPTINTIFRSIFLLHPLFC